ncbi:hypothetical protein MSG28_011553 [Choristoneura fumiferana]|uniref:Uncharacterized protein n=1 Tax=Choristoneura fumiferana TaxID=7141 RepID=A0ACC0JPE0_CHOFU|nr:hypothetical protein MSG28_011553 [Choristoneura fumiferana]
MAATVLDKRLTSLIHNEFDVIIIPVKHSQSEPIQELSNSRNRKRPKNYNNFRLDVENYDEPTETPDVDNFNPIERDDSSAQRLGDDDEQTLYEQVKDLGQEYEAGYGGDKIVGGTEVEINLYPYHVAYGSNCGGAIIGKKWVITAGHCGKKPYIRTGSKYLNQGRKVLVKNNFIHPEWGASSKQHPFDFDFQVLELMEELKYDENTRPVKVAHIEDMVLGKVVTVTGWGNTEENGPYSNVLRAVRVPIISKENCQHVPFPYFRGGLTSRMFCAGFKEGKKDACQGDSGGPAVAYDRLLGIISFGYGCATPGSYGVYSKVAKVRTWIEGVTGLKLD